MLLNRNLIVSTALIALLALNGCGDRAEGFEKGAGVPVSDVDTDSDGLSDTDEINSYNTDPKNPDTDGDGLTDGEEVNGVDSDMTTAVATAISDPLDPCDPAQSAGYRGYDKNSTVWQAANCDGDDYLNGQEDSVTEGYLSDPYDAKSECFRFEDHTYCEIDNAEGNVTWMDRALGAEQPCDANKDWSANRKCAGDYYQWGRVRSGHEKLTSSTTDTQITSLVAAKSSHKFIILSNDWLTGADATKTEPRITLWRDSTTGDICPVGWYVPSKPEMKEMINEVDAREHFLLPLNGGYRADDDGDLTAEEDVHSLWTSSASAAGKADTACHLRCKDTIATPSLCEIEEHVNAYGSMVRCIKEPKKSSAK